MRNILSQLSFILIMTNLSWAQTLTPTSVATISQIQKAMITPASDAIFNVGRTAPTCDDEWQALENAAVVLTEAGNLFMMEGRRKDEKQWMEFTAAMVNAGTMALRAAEVRDVNGLLDAGNNLIDVCEACHQPYRDGGRAMGPPPDVENR